jgi:hypothetical protein
MAALLNVFKFAPAKNDAGEEEPPKDEWDSGAVW